MRVIEKYLAQYAEAETASAVALLTERQQKFAQALVIPAYNESEVFITRLASSPIVNNCLLILVINQPENQVCDQNRALYKKLVGEVEEYIPPLSLIQQNDLHILIVDRFSPGKQIPGKQGVGLARKIGVDIGCALHHAGIIKSPWIYSSDADAHLPDNYFSEGNADAKIHSARVFNFFHIDDDSPTAHATLAYESALKYYRDGLAWAQSPYAFYTLGSTLAVNVLHYTQARGFPKRAGGEDFYLLNKLAKLGTVNFDQHIHINIDARISQRVPFGTGPAVESILQLQEQKQDYCYYNPEIFIQLKAWLHWATHELPTQILDEQTLNIGDLPKTLQTAAIDLALEQFVSHAKKQCKNPEAVRQHFHHWFDAFRTLKFIHLLQKQFFPACTIGECLQAQENWRL